MLKDIEISPVSKQTIKGALEVIHQSFHQFSHEEDPDLWFKMSLNPKKNINEIKKAGTRDIRYFVALNKMTHRVVGTTGLYHQLDDPEGIVWLGWYCVDPEWRGQGIGSLILQWTIDKAIEEGESVLRLYTSPEHNSEAQSMYDKFGFVTTKTEGQQDGLVAYKELRLK